MTNFMTKMRVRSVFYASEWCCAEHKNVTLKMPETLDIKRKNLRSLGIAGFSSWQGMRDSNPRKRSQSPVCYRYTNPLNGFFPKRMIIITISCKKSRLIFSFLQKLKETFEKSRSIQEAQEKRAVRLPQLRQKGGVPAFFQGKQTFFYMCCARLLSVLPGHAKGAENIGERMRA